MCLRNSKGSIRKENLFYKQMFGNGCFTVVEVLLWINDKVLLEDVKSGIKYVLTGDEFLQFHETLYYKCDLPNYTSSELARMKKWHEAK